MNSFATALLDPDQPVPLGVVNPDGGIATRRFNVYRNNVAVGLSDALELSFPVIRQLLGDAFFRAMAGVFLRQHPPTSPLMMIYGDQMPAFLAAFPPVAHLPYLPDMARLELAIRQSYHAADAAPMDAAQLGLMTADALMLTRFDFAPAVRLVQSDWPIHAIWLAHADPAAPKPVAGPQSVLITRPQFDPALDLLSPAAAQVAGAMMAGATLGHALSLAHTDFDIAGLLTLFLTQGAVTGLI